MPNLSPDRGRMITQLRKAFPRAFFNAVVAVLREVYADAVTSEEGKLTGWRLHLVVGTKKFAYAEERVLKLAAAFKLRDVTITEVKGTGGSVHVEIRSGLYVLTLAGVKKPDQFVRVSKYREELAGKHQQFLFPDPTREAIGAEYYGILIHGPLQTASGFNYSRLGFLKVALPNQEFNGYATDHLDVLSLYNIPLSPVVTNNTEVIPDKVRPRLKPKPPSTLPPNTPPS